MELLHPEAFAKQRWQCGAALAPRLQLGLVQHQRNQQCCGLSPSGSFVLHILVPTAEVANTVLRLATAGVQLGDRLLHVGSNRLRAIAGISASPASSASGVHWSEAAFPSYLQNLNPGRPFPCEEEPASREAGARALWKREGIIWECIRSVMCTDSHQPMIAPAIAPHNNNCSCLIAGVRPRRMQLVSHCCRPSSTHQSLHMTGKCAALNIIKHPHHSTHQLSFTASHLGMGSTACGLSAAFCSSVASRRPWHSCSPTVWPTPHSSPPSSLRSSQRYGIYINWQCTYQRDGCNSQAHSRDASAPGVDELVRQQTGGVCTLSHGMSPLLPAQVLARDDDVRCGALADVEAIRERVGGTVCVTVSLCGTVSPTRGRQSDRLCQHVCSAQRPATRARPQHFKP
jgi:hypothetical protein